MRGLGEQGRAIFSDTTGSTAAPGCCGFIAHGWVGAGRECAAVFCCPDLGAVLWYSSVLLLALQMPG